jgi:hypothetical protein
MRLRRPAARRGGAYKEVASKLAAELKQQPSWSDLPLILITGSGEAAQARPRHLAALDSVGNVSIIERPCVPRRW